MTPAPAALAVAAMVLLSGRGPRRRLQLPRRRGSRRPRRAILAAVVCAAAGILALGPVVVAVTGVVVALLVARRGLRSAAPIGSADLALALDVLASCLAAGASMPAALAAARIPAPSRVANAFAVAAVALGLGDEPGAVWMKVGSDVPELAAVSRLCSRAAATGAPISGELHRLAAAQRASLDTSRRRRLQRASVWLVLPLGLCFLPAFVLVGVVPLVMGAIPRATH